MQRTVQDLGHDTGRWPSKGNAAAKSLASIAVDPPAAVGFFGPDKRCQNAYDDDDIILKIPAN